MTTLKEITRLIQRHVGVAEDGAYGPATANAIVNAFALKIDEPEPFNLKAFFDKRRELMGPLKDGDQVNGFEALLKAMREARWPLAWAAYGLATAWHETARTMQPVREAYWLSEDWRRKNLRYYPWYGRGYVQLTWERNYKAMGEKIGADLTSDPDVAMQPEIAAKVLIRGMADGDYNRTGKGLGHYLPSEGAATQAAFEQARRTVNIMDKAKTIAGYARQFQTALIAGGW